MSACASAFVVRSQPFVNCILTPPPGIAPGWPPRLVGGVAADSQHRLAAGCEVAKQLDEHRVDVRGSRPV